jgi:hypothetical protein
VVEAVIDNPLKEHPHKALPVTFLQLIHLRETLAEVQAEIVTLLLVLGAEEALVQLVLQVQLGAEEELAYKTLYPVPRSIMLEEVLVVRLLQN